MNIVICTDEKYAMPCGVCVMSLFENNRDLQCNVYILTDWLSEQQRAKFEKLSYKYSKTITIITIPTSQISKLKVSTRFSKSIYYRFLIPNLLKNESKALYLDCDIIVNGCLDSFYNIDLKNYGCGVIEDQCCDDIRIYNRLNMKGNYFNSGVLLMNLDYWRENNITEKCIDFIYRNPEVCVWPDQDALNIILNEKVIYCPYGYNFQTFFLLNKFELFVRKEKWSEIDKWKENPIIIHFTTDLKPWHKECNHPCVATFLKYKNMSPWKHDKLNFYNSLKQRIIIILKRLFRI